MEPLAPDDPRQVGGYRVTARLGSGGMGVVYLARTRYGRKVAVKVVRESFAADEEYRARFRREVKAARKVSGAFTAAVLAADPDARSPWLATMFLPGITLRDAVERFGPFDTDAVHTLAMGLAEALRAIHSAGVLHRDLKPGNVILTVDGPKVIDFGVAHPHDASWFTRVGMTAGTTRYMAPEQFRGESVPATDLYALGLVLRYAATGRPPPPSGRTVDVDGIDDRQLSKEISICLRSDPRRRRTATALLNRLAPARVPLRGTEWLPPGVAGAVRAAGTGRPNPAGPVPAPDDATTEPAEPPEPPSRPWPRRSVLGVTGVSAALLIAADSRNRPASVVRTPDSSAPDGHDRPVPELDPVWTTDESVKAPEIGFADGMVCTWTQNTTMRAFDAKSGDLAWERDITDANVSGGLVFINDDTDWYLLKALDPVSGDVVWTARSDGTLVARPATGPVIADGHCCFGAETLTCVSPKDGSTKWNRDVDSTMGIAVNDRWVVAVGETKLTIVDVDSGDTTGTLSLKGWSPTVGDDIAFGIDPGYGTLHALRATDGEPLWKAAVSSFAQVRLPCRDGLIHLPDGGGAVRTLRADTGEPVWSKQISHGEGSDYGYTDALHRSGDVLYAAGTNRTVCALDANDGTILWTYLPGATVTAPPVTGAGLVFIATTDGTVHALAPPS